VKKVGDRRSPLWVILDQTSRPCLSLDVRFPAKTTEASLCSEMTRWAFPDSCSAANLRLFNHLVGELLQVQGYLKAKRLGGREVDNQIEFLRPLYR
jgi:hypothetical protein